MKERLKAPELRFPGFTDDWEERKLGELSNIVGGGTPSTSNPEYWDGDIDWYAPAEIGEQSYVSKSKKTITELGLKKSSARILPVGTVLFTSRAGIGNTAILAKEATTNQGFQSIVPDQNKLDSYFIFSRTNELKRYGEVTGAGSTFVEVSGKQMSKMSIMVPELSEQRKIGLFFKQLDDTIVLHQRKLDLLKEQKKGYLQKMFPKNGSKIPELRFTGFADDWEERKLGEVATFLNGRAYKQDELLDSGKYKVLRVGNFYTNDSWYYSNMELGDKYYVDKGDLVYTWSATFGPHIWSGEKVIYHYHIWKVELSKFLDRNFTLQLLEADKARLLSSTNGSTMIHVTKGDMESKIVSIPNIDEQKQIGSFFKQLDNTITLHQRKLDLLKEQKKGFLQKMFI
ncbi:restriction endonuclease subunit S [Lactococcus lactis]|uniref:restriction endonuclease subunit S n=1 Tax=Lactococcus lactis TaxID=1358 RepID=UPI0012AACEC1|nr:restriction endonuclease subunit S [Lactococcus lactis]QPT48801.1 restriction endonuclease subunit S [Lactococcus lactis]